MEAVISIIVPVYNGQAYLTRCVRAIQAQTYSDWELLLVDDGSTDGSLELCCALAAEDSRITALFQENAGVSAARNAALQASTGAYLAFVDADDTPDPRFLETLFSALVAEGADLSCCGFLRVHADSGRTDTLPTGFRDRQVADRADMARLLLRPDGYTTVVWNKLLRREAVFPADAPPVLFDPALHIVEDGDFLFRAHIRTAVFLPQPLYTYVVHGSSTMYGCAPTPRRRTELAARQKIVALTAGDPRDVQDLAKMKYQKGVRDLLFHAVIGGYGTEIRDLLPELRRYRRELYRSPALTGTDKLKYWGYGWLIRWNLRRLGGVLMDRFG